MSFRAGIDAVLEGRCGAIVTAPGSKRLDLGPFSMLQGDPASEGAASLVKGVALPRIFVDCPAWHGLIREHNETRNFERVRRIEFSADRLNDERLWEMRHVPDGMQLLALDVSRLRDALDQVSADLLIQAVFPSPEAFDSGGGFGFAVVQHDRVLAAATSAIVSDRHIEIQINTSARHRRGGLATAVGAAIVLESRARGLEPGWDTESAASEGLARKLGYEVAREYEWLVLDAGR